MARAMLSSPSIMLPLVRLFAFVSLFLLAAPAIAQEMTVSRVTGNNRRGPPGTVGINRQDCIDNIKLTFSLSLTGLAATTYDFQVWAGNGVDCQDINNRSGSNVSRCRQIAQPQRTTSSSIQVVVPARNLAASIATTPQPSGYVEPDEDICDVQTTVGSLTSSVYFMIVNGNTVVKATTFKGVGSAAGTTASTPQEGVVVDLKGPDPPSNVRLSTGDRRLRVDWTPTGDRDVKGYVFYCQEASKAPSDGGTTTTRVCPEGGTSVDAAFDPDADPDAAPVVDDAGVVDPDAGCVDVETAAGGTCPSPIVSPETECGRLVQTGATSGNTARRLVNLVEYAVSVAALDAFDNVGTPVAASQCGTPEAVADFWREFNAAGGNAGGFCALEAVGLPVGSNLAAAASALAAVLVVRRVRRKR